MCSGYKIVAHHQNYHSINIPENTFFKVFKKRKKSKNTSMSLLKIDLQVHNKMYCEPIYRPIDSLRWVFMWSSAIGAGTGLNT